MIQVTGIYENGQITLQTPLPEKKAKVIVTVLEEQSVNETTVTLQDQEFKLVQTIRNIGESREFQETVIANLIQEIEILFEQHPHNKPIKWLQIGDIRRFRVSEPVKPKPGAPLTSDIIIEQRRQR